MPVKLIKKVTSLLRKKTKSAPASVIPDATPTPLPQPPPPAPVAAPVEAVAAPATPKPRSRSPRTDVEGLPPPVREIRQKRGSSSEEWRPSRRPRTDEAAPEKAPVSADASPAAVPAPAARPPRRERSDAPHSSENRRERGPRREPREPRPPREPAPAVAGETAPREARRERGPRRERRDEPEREHSPSRGKGFSFPRAKPEAVAWDRSNYTVPEVEGKTRFADLDLPDELLHAVSDLGYQYCTPIQAGILPQILSGNDGLGQAQTGTGKTAAFLLSSFARMLKTPCPDLPNGAPRLLILAPTRELVIQIEEEAAILAKHTPFQSLPVYGGLDYDAQRSALRNNRIEIVAATPGRLIDFLRSHVVDLSHVETLVLDEADRMLDMGFIPDVKRIVMSTPHKDRRQTLFFSATFTDEVRRLAESWTRDAVSVRIEPKSVAADTVDQTVFIVTDEEKFALTVNLLRDLNPARTLIFANRRDSAQDLCDRLNVYEFRAQLLTGAVPQAKRVRTLEDFREGKLPIIVATDVAGRGIHVEDVALVINYNLPEDPEDYVHRIGRTGRAGASGRSVCFACEFDAMAIPDIEKFIGRSLVCTHPDEAMVSVEKRDGGSYRGRRDGGGRNRGGGGPRGAGRGGPRRGGPPRRR
jgi:ATP-dependent RNA helicase RhlB